jgi:hypothetical protein
VLEQFTWKRAAERTVDAYREAIEQRRRDASRRVAARPAPAFTRRTQARAETGSVAC